MLLRRLSGSLLLARYRGTERRRGASDGALRFLPDADQFRVLYLPPALTP